MKAERKEGGKKEGKKRKLKECKKKKTKAGRSQFFRTIKSFKRFNSKFSHICHANFKIHFIFSEIFEK